MADPDLNAVFDMYAKIWTGFAPQAMCVPTEQGPTWIFPDGTCTIMNEEGDVVGSGTWKWNPEWLKELEK